MKKRLEALKKDQKGFTLVELIVVLVILAILAALLVPALLGYIDRARQGKYLEEARSIYTALQAVQDENYAKGAASLEKYGPQDTTDSIHKLITPTQLVSITKIKNRADSTANKAKDEYVIKYISGMVFTSQDGKTVNAKMDAKGTWTVNLENQAQTISGDEEEY